MLALMGPSGSGKTTLLNLLARRFMGKNARTEGEVSVNGARCSTAYFRTISTYVEQEDALTGSLTVRETIDFCARLSSTRYAALTRRNVKLILCSEYLRELRAGRLFPNYCRPLVSPIVQMS